MNKVLFTQINKYTEDREIDYIAVKVIGEQQGIVWKNEQQLVELKQVIDRYLKTFEEKNFALVEMKIKALSGKNTRTAEEAEELTHFAATEKQMRKPNSKQNIMKKKSKKLRESNEMLILKEIEGKYTTDTVYEVSYKGRRYYRGDLKGQNKIFDDVLAGKIRSIPSDVKVNQIVVKNDTGRTPNDTPMWARHSSEIEDKSSHEYKTQKHYNF